MPHYVLDAVFMDDGGGEVHFATDYDADNEEEAIAIATGLAEVIGGNAIRCSLFNFEPNDRTHVATFHIEAVIYKPPNPRATQ